MEQEVKYKSRHDLKGYGTGILLGGIASGLLGGSGFSETCIMVGGSLLVGEYISDGISHLRRRFNEKYHSGSKKRDRDTDESQYQFIST